ncbi:hypothetical protein ACQ7CX_08205 [Chryseobacterium arthrosphaerae]|uniref:hypothetical protein n=1 Tax=Chryseobacterium arthrosphaerae TaxID=651561 RepID=UPI001BAE5718|nr:hypothetical protein [Chryseobacterium arthrosphaerae]QUY56557.1 hypothetical protein I2F65_04250 [Chryseobacterium arthrosphaerae]
MEIDVHIKIYNFLNISVNSEKVLNDYLNEHRLLSKSLMKLDAESYLDDIPKFFLTYKLCEEFYFTNEKLIEEYRDNINSLILFCVVTGRDELWDRYNFEIIDYNDAIIFIYLFYKMELFYIIDRVIENSELLTFIEGENYDEPIFKDHNLLLIAPFIFDKADLVDILSTDISLITDNKNMFRMLDKIAKLPERLEERTLLDHVKLFNKNYILDDIEADFSNIPCKLNSALNIAENKIYSEFLDFPILFDMEEYKQFDLDLKIVTKTEIQKIEFQELKEKVNTVFIIKKYKKLLKLNINHTQVITLFNGFVDKVLDNNEPLKNDFKDLFTFIVDESINKFPTTNHLTVKDVKYIMRFFSKYKGVEFEYNVPDLQYLLTHFASKPEQYKNSSINKAHREDRFNIDPKIQKELNSLIR